MLPSHRSISVVHHEHIPSARHVTVYTTRSMTSTEPLGLTSGEFQIAGRRFNIYKRESVFDHVMAFVFFILVVVLVILAILAVLLLINIVR